MIDSDAYINKQALEVIDHIVEDSYLGGTYKIGNASEQEERHISELWRMSDNMDKRELAAICARTVRKYPMIYYVLSDPRRMNRTVDYPFTHDDLELFAEAEKEGQEE